jgi:hypothetical protein
MMDSNRFDQLTSFFGTRMSRRNAVTGSLGAGALGLASSGKRLAAQDATPAPTAPDATPTATEENKPAFLFVQLFDQGTWVTKPDEEGDYLLTLTGAAAQTLYFSDRPERIVGTVDTVQFLEVLGFTPVNPPNAALVVRTPEGERDVLVIELFDPVYTEDITDPGNVTVAYGARVLDAYHGDGLTEWAIEQKDDELPEQFSDASLFIDDCPDLYNCEAFLATNEADGHWVTFGPIPGGPYGRCFSAWQLSCVPCNNSSDFYDSKCNNAYAGCNGQCDTTCKWGGCP